MSRRSKDILLIALVVIFAVLIAQALGLFGLVRAAATAAVYVVALIILAGIAVLVWQRVQQNRRRR